ncbi:hypothetical protein THAOC_31630, partial [Thalassiosira oceanica]
FNEALYFGDKMDNSPINPNQVRDNSIPLDNLFQRRDKSESKPAANANSSMPAEPETWLEARADQFDFSRNSAVRMITQLSGTMIEQVDRDDFPIYRPCRLRQRTASTGNCCIFDTDVPLNADGAYNEQEVTERLVTSAMLDEV